MSNKLDCEKNKKVVVQFSGEEISLPDDLRGKIMEYWEAQIKSGRKYFNGEVFTLDEIVTGDKIIEIIVKKNKLCALFI